MNRIRGWGVFAVLGLCACSGGGNETVDRNVEGRLTITQGVYGQTTSQDDVGDNPVQYYSMNLAIFPKGETTNPINTVTSDAQGFYQLGLDPGAYSLCTSFNRCTNVELKAGECVRLDYSFSIALGWSEATTMPCPR